MAQLVSVCLPVWNGANFVEAAINSVLAQTHSDFELIVIDDCSTDQSASIINRLAAKDSRIRFYRNQTRLGLFENYNKCMSLAKGDYIKPFAQDDLLAPQMVEQLLKLFSYNSDVVLASCARNWIDGEDKLLGGAYRSIPTASDIFFTGQRIARSKLLQCSIFPIVNLIGEPAAVLFPRNVIGNGFDTRYKHLGDLEYWLRLLESGKFICTSEKLCSIRVHEKRQSVSNVKSLAIATDYIELAKDITPSVSALGYSGESFFRSAIIELAQHLNYTIRNNKIDFLTEKFAAENPLYEVALHSLLLIANNKQEVMHPGMERRIRYNERHIVRMERYLRRLLSDPGWYLTRPLRELSSVFGVQTKQNHFAVETSKARHSAESGPKALLQQQSSYLHYLRRTVAKIKQSHSWRIAEELHVAISSILNFIGIESANNNRALFDRSIYRTRSPKLAARRVNAQAEHSSYQTLREIARTAISSNLDFTVSPIEPDDKAYQKPNQQFNFKSEKESDIKPDLKLDRKSENKKTDNEPHKQLCSAADKQKLDNKPKHKSDIITGKQIGAPSQHLEKLYGVLNENYTLITEIEPALPTSKEISKFSKYEAPRSSEMGRAYFKLANMIKKPFTHLILMGDSSTEKSAELAFNLSRTTIQSSDDILILFTDENHRELESAQNYRSLSLNDIAKDLDSDKRVDVVVRLILQSAPESVTNVGSGVAWKAIRDYHRQLRKYSRLKVCLAESATSETRFSKTELSNLNWCMDFIDELHVTSDAQMNFIIDKLALEPSNQWKILVSTFWNADEQPVYTRTNEQIYAITDFSPAAVTLEQLMAVPAPVSGGTAG